MEKLEARDTKDKIFSQNFEQVKTWRENLGKVMSIC